MKIEVMSSHMNRVTKYGFEQYTNCWITKVYDPRYGNAFFSSLVKPTARQIRKCIKEWKRGLTPSNTES